MRTNRECYRFPPAKPTSGMVREGIGHRRDFHRGRRGRTALRRESPGGQDSRLLAIKLTRANSARSSFRFMFFPRTGISRSKSGSTVAILYPDSVRARKASHLIKRCLDIAGSLWRLLWVAPVPGDRGHRSRLTSKGPVLFRQDRVGQYGGRFTFLKFRSMYVNNDQAIHRDYINSLIAGTAGARRLRRA